MTMKGKGGTPIVGIKSKLEVPRVNINGMNEKQKHCLKLDCLTQVTSLLRCGKDFKFENICHRRSINAFFIQLPFIKPGLNALHKLFA